MDALDSKSITIVIFITNLEITEWIDNPASFWWGHLSSADANYWEQGDAKEEG